MGIKYGYFRHRFDAHTDTKINNLVDEMGIIGYGYYFSLVEIYGQKYAQGHDDGFVEIHIRVIANTWRKRVDSCDKVLTKLQLSDLLVVTSIDSIRRLRIENFPKYFGSYSKTTPVDPPNKRKEKKRKENSILSPPSTGCVDVINYLNEKTGKNFKPSSKSTQSVIKARFGEGFNLEDFKKVIDLKTEQWGSDPKMGEYLRPSTLFGTKFESYLNQNTSVDDDWMNEWK